METINPRISFSSIGKYAKNGSEMSITTLKAVLDRCASDEFKGKAKGSSGCILPYVSEKFGDRPFVHEGVVILDLDRFNKEPKLMGKENLIYEKFDEIASKYMPNLLAMNFSYSHNLHVFIYDRNVVDETSYNKWSAIYMAIFAKIVNKLIDIDLRHYEGALDDHQKAYQKLFINHSPYKWNIYCTQPTKLSDKELKALQQEYKITLGGLDAKREIRDTTPMDATGTIAVDKSYYILGWSGWDARTVIAAAAFFHFNKNIEQAKKWIYSKFSNADAIYAQMQSMANSGSVVGMYRRDVEKILFKNDEEKTILKSDEYLSDVIDFDKLTEKYYYIQSNTNTGKTEFVKRLLLDRKEIKCDNDDLFSPDRKVVENKHKVIVLQATKALRDGKKQGVEDKTFENWESIGGEISFHTTLEGFKRNARNVNLEEYTIIVDESHLLEEYITFRTAVISELLEYLDKAGKVIFMSATPKSDIKIFPFKLLRYEKIQQQKLEVFQRPLYVAGRGSINAARYTYMSDFVRTLTNDGEKVLVFSNKKQSEWKNYGLENGVTLFNAANHSDSAVQDILNDNRLSNSVTLATKYMGCGVEVKNEKKVHLVFFLDEGWDFDFFAQAIGRPRDAETICVHLFYSKYKDWKSTEGKWYCGLKRKKIEAIKNALDHLTARTLDGIQADNVLAVMMTGMYEPNRKKEHVFEKVKKLVVGDVLTESSVHSPYSLDLFKQLPYKDINVQEVEPVVLNLGNKKLRVREEREIIEYLCNCSDEEWRFISDSEYEDIFKVVAYKDKVVARKTIHLCKYIRNRLKLNLKSVFEFFDKTALVKKYMIAFARYCNLEAGWDAVEQFEGSASVEEELKGDVNRLKAIFTKEFLEDYIADIIRMNYVRTNNIEFKLCLDDVFKDVMKEMGLWKDTDEEPIVRWIDFNYEEVEMFQKKTYKESIDRKQINSINGKKGGRQKQTVSMQIVETGEVKVFGSKTECAEYLKSVGCSSRQFNKLLKDEGDFASKYKILIL